MEYKFLVALYKITDTTGSEEGSVGEVSIQVDLFTHPGTGEQKVTVKGRMSFRRITYTYLSWIGNRWCY